MVRIYVSRASEMSWVVLRAIYRFRAHIFYDELKWDVTVVNGEEKDKYDELDPIWVVAMSNKQIVGCLRILPTTGEYLMMEPAFEGLSDTPLPHREDIVEISRFAVSLSDSLKGNVSLSTYLIIQHSIECCLKQGAPNAVFVTSAAMERLMRGLGAQLKRLGKVKRISDCRVVACEMDVAAGIHDRETVHPMEAVA